MAFIDGGCAGLALGVGFCRPLTTCAHGVQGGPSSTANDRQSRPITPFSPKNDREFTTAVTTVPSLVTRKASTAKATVRSADTH